jgi:cobalt/nickel transport system ATP-binding protein
VHLDPHEALCDGHGARPLLRALVLTLALVANGLGQEVQLPLAVLGLGLLALGVEVRRPLPFALLGVGLLQAALLVAAGGWLLGAPGAALVPATRALAGLAWSLWFGATVSWPDLEAALRRAGAPSALLDAVGGVVSHGLLLTRELRRRWEGAAVRLGLARGQPRLETCALVLAGGVERALDRAAALEDARRLRVEGAPRPAAPDDAAARAPEPEAGAEPPVAELRSVDLHHADGQRGLTGLGLTLRPGEWVALAGPSGSGKSTLLRGLAGLLAPAAGELRRFGVPLERGPLGRRIDRRVALVFQDPNDQLFGATPEEDLAWGLRRLGVEQDAAARAAHGALEALGIAALARRPVHHLSLGERKRVAFAAALVGAPELLLFDEPTSALDPLARRRLVDALDAAASPRATVVWATHDLDALPARVSRVVLLREGRVVFDGPRAEGLAPATLARAGLAPEAP